MEQNETNIQMKFGDELPRQDTDFGTQYIRPEIKTDQLGEFYEIFFQGVSDVIHWRTFHKKDGNGVYKRIGIELQETDKATGKPKELMIPPSVYGQIVTLMKEYDDKVKGVRVRWKGQGKDTKYTVMPLF